MQAAQADSTEQEQMSRTDQTFCAIFDLWVKVIDAEFYGAVHVQWMEYVLRLCEALPERIWMSYYTPTTLPLQLYPQPDVPNSTLAPLLLPR